MLTRPAAIKPILSILFVAVLTPIFYPSLFGDYYTGLSLFETAILVVRNLVLVAALAMLILDAFDIDYLDRHRAYVSRIRSKVFRSASN